MRIHRSKHSKNTYGDIYPYEEDGIEAICKFIADEMNAASGKKVFEAKLVKPQFSDKKVWKVVSSLHENVSIEPDVSAGWHTFHVTRALTRIEVRCPHPDPNHYRGTKTQYYEIKSTKVNDNEADISFNAKGAFRLITRSIEERKARQESLDSHRSKVEAAIKAVAKVLKPVRERLGVKAYPGADTLQYDAPNGTHLTVYGNVAGYTMTVTMPHRIFTDPLVAAKVLEAIANIETPKNPVQESHPDIQKGIDEQRDEMMKEFE